MEQIKKVVEMKKVKGQVLSNNGSTAKVRFANGDEKFFARQEETEAEFRGMFPLRGTVHVERFAVKVTSRAELFDALEGLFGKPSKTGVALIGTNSGETVIGLTHQFKHTVTPVFCSEGCFHPDGGLGFAVMEGEAPCWFHFAQGELEEAFSMLANGFASKSKSQDQSSSLRRR